ncbi:MAG: tRNA epoxyqueuosine(34) reductase QueG [Rikenellaceae bacterium]
MLNICKEAVDLGFSVAAVVHPRSLASKYGPILEHRINNDYDEQIAYMRRNLDKRLDPRLLFEGARSIVVCGLSSANLPFDKGTQARIASYGLCRDYHIIIKELLFKLAEKLKEAYPRANFRAFVDTAPLLEKAWAVEAGLGYIGRNSLLINKEHGTRLFLGELITDIQLPETNLTPTTISCNNCTACVDNCPTGAIKMDGSMDSRLCISRRTIEKQDIPYNNRELSGWIFGCELCQQVCPHNIDITKPLTPMFQLLCPAPPSKQQWLEMSTEQFNAVFKHSPLKRSGLERIKKALE